MDKGNFKPRTTTSDQSTKKRKKKARDRQGRGRKGMGIVEKEDGGLKGKRRGGNRRGERERELWTGVAEGEEGLRGQTNERKN